MDALTGWLIALTVISAWIVLVYILAKKGLLARLNMAPVGPIIMWKTKRGRDFLDRLSRPKRFWRAYGDFAIVLCIASMVILMGLLIWEATLVPSIPKASAPSPELALGVPGINPVIPIGYGILGLAVAIIVHEFLHGVLARTAGIRLQSLGILLFVFPIGAFVEPDEEEMQKMPRHARARLFAAGPATNIIFALLFALVFSNAMMGSVRPAHEGVGIRDYSMSNSPAQQAGLVPGMIIFRANNTNISNLADMVTVLDNAVPGEKIPVMAYYHGDVSTHIVNLTESGGRAVMGVVLMTVTTAYFHPIGGADFFGGLDRSAFSYLTLPFSRIQPTEGAVADFYVIEGAWASIPAPLFWLLANSFYWLMWLNIMLGATNALPAIPLDGGYIFRDGMDAVLERTNSQMSAERRQKVIRGVSYSLALFVLALILWQFVGPRIL